MKKSLLILNFCVLLWGFTGIFGKAIDLHHSVLVWWRLLLVIAIMLLVQLFYKWISKISLRDFFIIGGVGILVGLHWIFFYGSVKYSNASVGISCISLVAVFTGFTEPLINKTKFNALEIFLSVLAVIGMWLVLNAQPDFSYGILLGVLSALTASIFSVLNKRITSKYPSTTITFYEMVGAIVIVSVFSLYSITKNSELKLLPAANEWWMLLVFVVVCTLLPFILSLVALRNMSAFTSNLTVNLEPVYGMILAALLFQENKELNWKFYLGAGIIISSVALYYAIKYLIRYNRNSRLSN